MWMNLHFTAYHARQFESSFHCFPYVGVCVTDFLGCFRVSCIESDKSAQPATYTARSYANYLRFFAEK